MHQKRRTMTDDLALGGRCLRSSITLPRLRPCCDADAEGHRRPGGRCVPEDQAQLSRYQNRMILRLTFLAF